MRYRHLLLLIVPVLMVCCKKDTGPITYPIPKPQAAPMLLKEIVIPNLPSPYYHFEYNADSTVSFASFASGFNQYTVAYDGGRISEMRNNIIVNKDRLQYFYDNAGRVTTIRYADSTGAVYKNAFFTYDGAKLVKYERERKFGANFLKEKKITLTYHADGNLLQFTTQLFPTPINGQQGFTFVDKYEQYDDKINVEDFSLLHTEFFEHLTLLPTIKLQKNNPGKVSRTGDGSNYKIDYTYTYNDKNVPVLKRGAMLFLTGADAGKTFQLQSTYTYY